MGVNKALDTGFLIDLWIEGGVEALDALKTRLDDGVLFFTTTINDELNRFTSANIQGLKDWIGNPGNAKFVDYTDSILAAARATGDQAAQECGRASWYAMTSRTASGERMNPSAMTAAHRTLGFGTKIKVTNPRNGKSVVVRINDRGPFVRGRTLDVSKAAAQQLGFIRAGHAKLCYTRLG